MTSTISIAIVFLLLSLPNCLLCAPVDPVGETESHYFKSGDAKSKLVDNNLSIHVAIKATKSYGGAPESLDLSGRPTQFRDAVQTTRHNYERQMPYYYRSTYGSDGHAKSQRQRRDTRGFKMLTAGYNKGITKQVQVPVNNQTPTPAFQDEPMSRFDPAVSIKHAMESIDRRTQAKYYRSSQDYEPNLELQRTTLYPYMPDSYQTFRMRKRSAQSGNHIDGDKGLGENHRNTFTGDTSHDKYLYRYDPRTVLNDRLVRLQNEPETREDIGNGLNDNSGDDLIQLDEAFETPGEYMYDPEVLSGGMLRGLFGKELESPSIWDDRNKVLSDSLQKASRYMDTPFKHYLKTLPEDSFTNTDSDEWYGLLSGDMSNFNDEVYSEDEYLATRGPRLMTEGNIEAKYSNSQIDSKNLDEQNGILNYDLGRITWSDNNGLKVDDAFPYLYDPRVLPRSDLKSIEYKQYLYDTWTKPHIKTSKDITDDESVQPAHHFMFIKNVVPMDRTRSRPDVQTHVSNWYKPLSNASQKTKRGFIYYRFHDWRQKQKKARSWITTRYGSWFAPYHYYDGRGPLDSLASALIG